MAFAKTTAGQVACLTQVTANSYGGFAGALGGTSGGGLIKGYTTGLGTLLTTWTLPACTATSNAYAMTGTPPVATPGNNGVMAAYTVCTSGGTSLGQGTVTATGGGGDMTLNNTTVATTSNVTLSTWSHTEN